LVGRPKVRRQFGRPGLKWEDNIKKDPQKLKWRSMDWIALAQDADRCWALVSAAINLLVPHSPGKLLSSRRPVEEGLASVRLESVLI
jgi:hypothetical protein